MSKILLSYSLQKAITFAGKAHKRQQRKCNPVPYIVHPMTVAMLLQGYEYPDHVVVAGVLHDVLEDTRTTYKQLFMAFGKQIAELVKSVSEPDKSLPWEVRKRTALKHIEDADTEVLALKAADAISNMEDMYVTYQDQGDEMFTPFKKGKEHQLARYSALCRAILNRADAIDHRLEGDQSLIYPALESHLDTLLKIF